MPTSERYAPLSDPVIQAYAAGVDRTLLRENLRLTVEERFVRFEGFMRGVEALRGAAAKKNGRRVGDPAPQ